MSRVPGASNELRAVSVLIAEDNTLNGLLMAEQFRLLGVDAEIVGNGREALACWRSGRFAAVLTDIQMPEMDGYELAESIRREETAGARVPIIALTADASQDRAARWKAAGIDACLEKPAELSTIDAMLKHWTGPGRAESPARESAPDASPASEDPVDPRKLVLVVGDDASVLAECLAAFASSSKALGERIDSALARQDLAAVASLAHRLKGSAGAVGAGRLAALAGELEALAASGGGDCAGCWQLLRSEAARVEEWFARNGSSGASRLSEPRDS